MFLLLIISILSVGSHAINAPYHYDCAYCQPEQIHLSYGEKTNDIVVTWSTFDNPHETKVEFGEGSLDHVADGFRTLFTDGGKEKRKQWIHRVVLSDLKYNTKYVYHAGSLYGWSETFTFKTPPAGQDWVVRAAIYGDMGVKNAHSLSYLQEEAQQGVYDFIIHNGDFAYNMDDDNARVGDQFMRQIQPVAAVLPYMTSVGNHEQMYNFSNYKARFSMPNNATESMFYSWDIGPVHFVAISTEFYYSLKYGAQMVMNQYNWLIEDLKRANQKENRLARPWIVLYGHRPMYCSNSDDDDCGYEYTRTGLPILRMFGVEPLLKQYGVDIVIWAHEHSYERLWPVYDEKVCATGPNAYHNPCAPVHIVTGSAGCQEDTDKFVPHPPVWSAFRSTDYGYMRLLAPNKTHIHFEQVSVDKKGGVVDSFWVRKDSPRPAFYDQRENEVPACVVYKIPVVQVCCPVHIVTGSAGCQEGRDRFQNEGREWSAFRSQDYGYLKFKAYNMTHVHIEQISVDLDGQVIDKFWIVKDGKKLCD